jgi:hypothetical protein
MFRMECDRRVIIRFLWNDETNAYEITRRLQAQFDEHVYTLWTVRFWITEVRLGGQDLHDEIRTGRLPLDNLDDKILARLDESPFESARSIAETLYIARSTVLLHLHDSVGSRSFHLHWMPHLLTHDLPENERNMQKWRYHSWMLPNVIVGIILWRVICRGFLNT